MAQRSPKPTDVFIGTRIRMKRRMLNMSQSELGRLIGVTFQQIQKYENGGNRVGGSRLQQLATHLQVPVSYFFEGAPGETPAKPSKTDLTGVPDIIGAFFTLPYANELAQAYVALAHNQHRRVVADVAIALAPTKAAKVRRVA